MESMKELKPTPLICPAASVSETLLATHRKTSYTPPHSCTVWLMRTMTSENLTMIQT